MIELNQIDIKKVGKDNYLEYKLIKDFLNTEIYLDKTLKFNQWNSLYFLSIFYDHLAYITNLIIINKKNQIDDSDFSYILSEIDFLSARIDFFPRNYKI